MLKLLAIENYQKKKDVKIIIVIDCFIFNLKTSELNIKKKFCKIKFIWAGFH
jgi:hypothetical protein